MPCNILFSRYASPLNGATYHMVKPWTPSSYNRHSVVSIRLKVDSNVSHGILSNMPYNFAIDHCHSCLESCHKIFDNSGRDHVTCSFRCPHREKIHQADPVTKEALANDPWCPIHLPQCCIQPLPNIFHTVGRSSVIVKPQFCLTLEAYLHAAPAVQFPENHNIIQQSAR
jgi:hypothetical protein